MSSRWYISTKDSWFVVGDSFSPPPHLSLLRITVAVVTVIVVVMVVIVILVIIIIIVVILIVMMMMMIVIIHHLILDLLRIEFHHFSIYGVFGLITRVISLKS
jgi:hypothetical protein